MMLEIEICFPFFIDFFYQLIDFDMDYLFCYFGSNLISGTTINLPTMLILNLAIHHVFLGRPLDYHKNQWCKLFFYNHSN